MAAALLARTGAAQAADPVELSSARLGELARRVEANAAVPLWPRDQRDANDARPATASSANFQILCGPDGRDAKALLAEAEAARRRLALKWFGRALPDGKPLTFIDARIDPDKDTALTLPPVGRKDASPRIWIASPDAEARSHALAHELVHVLMHERFPEGMPAWANEGAASLEDDPVRLRIREALVQQWSRSGRWPALAILFRQESVAPGDLEAYTASASVVEFLLARDTRAEFLDFVEAGARRNWSEALRESYGFDDVAALQTAWQKWAADRAALRTAGKNRSSR